MTDELVYFDTDCISSFLVVDEERILLQLFPHQILLPQQVYVELSHPNVPHIRNKIKRLRSDALILIKDILTGTEEFELYRKLAYPSQKARQIGKGEAAAIALAKTYNGFLASNNMKDIKKYVDEYKLKHITTADILVKALSANIIDESDGNDIWRTMMMRRRKLPVESFSAYLRTL